MLRAAIALAASMPWLATGADAGLPRVALDKHEPIYVGKRGCVGGKPFYEQGIAEEDSIQFAHLPQFAHECAQWVRVPGQPDLFIASASTLGKDPGDYGLRLFLFGRTSKGFEQLDATRGARDSYVLDPFFLQGGGRTFVLAYMGTEYDWGHRVYELMQGKLQFLGDLTPVVDQRQSRTTTFLRGALEGSDLILEIDAPELYLEPDVEPPKAVRRGAQAFAFRASGGRFLRIR